MTQKSVLVADDDIEITQLLAMRLRRLGVAVSRSPDASHALVGAMRVPPDLVILDVNMPNGNGLAVCEMLAGNDRCSDIPVIVHTGQSDPSIIARCAQLGANYIQKAPGSPEKIVDIVRDALNISDDEIQEWAPDEAETSSMMTDERMQEVTASTTGGIPVPEATRIAHAERSDLETSDHTRMEMSSSTDQKSIPVDAATVVETGVALDGNDICLAEPCDSQRLVVLSIDDDADVSLSIQMSMKPYGVEVLSATTGQQGIQLAEKWIPDVIITDLVLPEAEGAYIVNQIRSNPALCDIPVIVLTGQSYPAIRHQVMNMGVDAFLTKPLSSRAIARELRLFIDFPKTPATTAKHRDSLAAASR